MAAKITTDTTTAFTTAERRTLRALRSRYQEDNDRFSDREMARLRFIRWLHQTGRVES